MSFFQSAGGTAGRLAGEHFGEKGGAIAGSAIGTALGGPMGTTVGSLVGGVAGKLAGGHLGERSGGQSGRIVDKGLENSGLGIIGSMANTGVSAYLNTVKPSGEELVDDGRTMQQNVGDIMKMLDSKRLNASKNAPTSHELSSLISQTGSLFQ